MTICYFGTYKFSDSRNRIIFRGLKENGVKIIECQADFLGWKRYLGLIRKLIRQHKKIKHKYDIMVVGYPSELMVPLAKFISKKPIAFDAFISRYNTEKEKGRVLRAGFYWLIDWLSCKLADLVLLDTNQHIEYFIDKYHLDRKKLKRIFVGADDNIFKFYPSRRSKNFKVLFYAKITSMHGIEHILRAAQILEKYPNIEFNIIGKGEQYWKIIKTYKDSRNIKFFKEVSYKNLSQFIRDVDVCLGIFGGTQKSRLVIPKKVFEAIAMKKPVISGESMAMRELFKDRENCLFCKMANAKDLAEKILELKNNPELRNKIAKNSYKLFKQRLTPKILGKELWRNFLKLASI